MKVIVTEKGAKMKSNNWIEGQEIECHENIGNYFIEKGIAKNIGDEFFSENNQVEITLKKNKKAK